MLTEKDIKTFKEIYKNCYGEEISIEDARTMANSILNFYRVVLTPYSSICQKDFAKNLDDGIIDKRRNNEN
jgi:hypothetical protein